MKSKTLKILATVFMSFTILSTSLLAAEEKNGVATETAYAYVIPDNNGEVACYIREGEEIVIVEETEGYYGVLIEENEIVYLEKQYIKEAASSVEVKAEEEVSVAPEVNMEVTKEEKVEAPKKQELSIGEQVVNYAKQFVGTPYRSGGNDLNKGVDCSGYTTAVFKHFGVTLTRSSRGQFASNGYKVSREQLKPGDLVFYGYGTVNHVAIYVGNDTVVHATVPGSTVKVSPMMQRGMAPIMGYKRVIE
ncbi:hypothetical protein CS063_07745 [Sporanaerobium hydrogeniformans]|uniref:Uncharacterized protein n=1 Tax=Sporanaerobium hydrogeniformans TaxID=3072179 RepID=A0AC61DCJ0_9FIRM|nr:C40 family peptidase [Sporanaerobium hydrogeniformans]PHV70906.1 hypothetical protein CS063_07745 [Sporanaerobium hydrogeniformans]